MKGEGQPPPEAAKETQLESLRERAGVVLDIVTQLQNLFDEAHRRHFENQQFQRERLREKVQHAGEAGVDLTIDEEYILAQEDAGEARRYDRMERISDRNKKLKLAETLESKMESLTHRVGESDLQDQVMSQLEEIFLAIDDLQSGFGYDDYSDEAQRVKPFDEYLDSAEFIDPEIDAQIAKALSYLVEYVDVARLMQERSRKVELSGSVPIEHV